LGLALSTPLQVTDFNLSKVVEDATRNSASSAGTAGATNPRWLAPEVLDGRRATDKSDVYAFGVVMWELLTWRLPWEGVPTWTIVSRVVGAGGEPLGVPAAADLPAMPGGRAGVEKYVKLMERCWARQPEARPDFLQVVQALKAM
jgi:serine/threonine protein kinase